MVISLAGETYLKTIGNDMHDCMLALACIIFPNRYVHTGTSIITACRHLPPTPSVKIASLGLQQCCFSYLKPKSISVRHILVIETKTKLYGLSLLIESEYSVYYEWLIGDCL